MDYYYFLQNAAFLFKHKNAFTFTQILSHAAL